MLADIAKLLSRKALSVYLPVNREWDCLYQGRSSKDSSENVFICLMAISISSVNFFFTSPTLFLLPEFSILVQYYFFLKQF